MRFMQRSKDSLAKWLSAILPVVIVGLVGLFAVTVIRDYGRASEADRQALLEKGNVLIRALESGSRVGMGMRMHHVQQQALLEEMAGQPGVLWFAVTDAQGIIILHSDPDKVGRALYSPDEMQKLKPEKTPAGGCLGKRKLRLHLRSIVCSSQCQRPGGMECTICRAVTAKLCHK